jgi:hypothetical protein
VTEGPHNPADSVPSLGDEERPAPPDPDDTAIDEVEEESFPASDSPSSWAGPPSRS